MESEAAQLLQQWGLGKYTAKFEAEKVVSLEIMGSLDEEDLRELGLKMGERKTFLKRARLSVRSDELL